jgi:hypothetical protein
VAARVVGTARQIPKLGRCFSAQAKWHRGNNSVGRVLLKVRIGAQLGGGNRSPFRSPQSCAANSSTSAALRMASSIVSPGREHAGHIGKRNTVAAVGIFMNKSNVMCHLPLAHPFPIQHRDIWREPSRSEDHVSGEE